MTSGRYILATATLVLCSRLASQAALQFGVQAEDVPAHLEESLRVPAGQGALIQAVEPDSPAARAGLQAGDVVLVVDRQQISDANNLFAIIRAHPAGGDVAIEIVRDGKRQTVHVQLAAGGDHVRYRPQTANPIGIAISNVREGSYADRAGLRPPSSLSTVAIIAVNGLMPLEPVRSTGNAFEHAIAVDRQIDALLQSQDPSVALTLTVVDLNEGTGRAVLTEYEFHGWDAGVLYNRHSTETPGVTVAEGLPVRGVQFITDERVVSPAGWLKEARELLSVNPQAGRLRLENIRATFPGSAEAKGAAGLVADLDTKEREALRLRLNEEVASLERSDRLHEAVDTLQQLVREFPDTPEAQSAPDRIAGLERRVAEEANTKKHEAIAARLAEGRARLAAGQPEAAVVAFQAALDVEPDDPEAKAAYQEALKAKAEGEKAAQDRSEAERHARVENNLQNARTLIATERYDDAASELRAARELAPNEPDVVALAEELKERVAEHDAAVRSKEGARWLEAGRQSLEAGKRVLAVDQLSEAAEVDPGNAEARRLLIRALGSEDEGVLALGVTLYPYDLVKNPFLQKNHLLRLDPRPSPLVANEKLIEYRVIAGREGIHFNRMLSEREALYDVGAIEDVTPRDIGQLIVTMPESSELGGQRRGDPLDPERVWKVQPLGVVEGANALGGPLAVPAVRFWTYVR